METYCKRIALVLTLTLTSVITYAYDFTYDGLMYKWIVGDYVRLYGISKLPDDGILIVPEKVYDSGELQYVDGISDLRHGKNLDLVKCIVINDNVDYIDPFALSECINLSRLEYNIRSCGFFATIRVTDNYSPFPNTISEVLIGDNVEYVPKAFLSRDIALEEILVPNSVTTIGHFAFMECYNLKKVEIGEKVATIGKECYVGSSNIESFTSYARIPPSLYDEDVFDTKTYRECTLYVPLESVSLYKEAKGWKNFFRIYAIGETPIEKIILDTNNINLFVGENFKLTATVEPANTTDKTITWTSDNETIAKVSTDGTVTAISVGVANITATCGDVSATCKVTVNPIIASGVKLNASNITLLIGQTDKLTATVEPANTTDKTVTWTSDNEAIAKVSADGTVTAVSVGVATITATCGDVSATCKVTVNPIVASGVKLSASNMTLLIGQSDKLTATIEPANTTDKTITWSSDNESIAKVAADGTVTAISVGVANIIVTCGEVSATCKVTVNPILASSIELSLQDMTLLIGSTATLTAIVYPENTTNQEITWTSADPSIVSVDASGKLSALQIGETQITASCGNISATCKVTVIAVAPTSIELNIKDMSLFIGQSETIQAVVRPANTTYPMVTWQSDDESVATVSSSGHVTGVTEGVANIIATCGDVSAVCKVTVNPIPASNIEITSGNVSVTIGNSVKLKAKISPDNTTHPDVEWISSDTDIATISADGTVTGVNLGTVIITAKCGNVSATCTVTVIPVPSEGIVITPTSVSMLLGESTTLSAIVYPETTTDKKITWSSDNPAVASVSSTGVVTALSLGTAKITAWNGNVSATCEVTVNPVVATSISLNVKDETIFVASSTQLVATISPANVTDKTITWISSKPEIATVSDEGIVTGVSVGTTTVTATCGSVSATCQINVVHRIPDMDPAVTTSDRDIKTLSGTPVNMAVYSEGGEPSGWSYVWTKEGQTVSESSELNINAKNDTETVIAETYRVKVENEIDKVIIFSEVYDFVVQIYPNIDQSADDRDITISTGNGNSNKTREGNAVTLSVATPNGGNDNGWEYVWTNAQGEIGEGQSIETVAEMSSGISMSVEESTYKVQLTNYGPDGDIWGQFSSEAGLEVYRRPDTPLQLLRKGDGKSHTFVVMMPLNDTQLSQLEYRYVYGWTDSEGIDHVIDVTDLRYCRAEAGVYDDSSNKFWVYSIWNYRDGSVVSSGRRYLDGSADEGFDGSDFEGNGVNRNMESYGRSAVFTIDGQYVGSKITNLSPGIYIYKSDINGVILTQKIIIR